MGRRRRAGGGVLFTVGAALCAPLACYALAGIGTGAPPLFAARVPQSGESRQFEIGGATITVNLAAGHTDLPAARIYAWVTRAARSVAMYYAGFPVTRAEVNVRAAPGRNGVFHGFTFFPESGTLTTRISVGEHTTEEELADDWMMTHELVHMTFPAMADEHHWIEEGIATYVEPIGRAQDGQIPVVSVWQQLVDGLPKGEPEMGDGGLDHTHTWGRTYWGGALFCLMADVGIRRETQNRMGLQDALRGIAAAGGTMEHDWPIERALSTGDKATGTTVLSDLYQKMKAAPAPVDLEKVWRELGVVAGGGGVRFRDDAPGAAIRLAITEPPRARLAPVAP
ncbi:MAG TPA: hypothetical protein VJW51_01895 [Candidatus Acidoferrales bacterium]|nr:hypothetical protein [Candidatus Acidoferrales bacterium]